MTQEEQIEQQKKIITELQKSLSEATVLLSQKDETISKKDERITSLENTLDWYRKQIFGKKSEKNLPVVPKDLMPSLFDELLSDQEKEQIAQDVSAHEQKEEKIIKVTTTSKRKKVDAIDTSKLEVIENVVEPENIDAEQYVRIGEEVTDKLIFVPSKFYIQRTIRPKYVLKSSLQIKHPEQQTFIVAPLAPSPFPKSLASSSLLTEIILQKYVYHLPYYRVIQKFKEAGLTVSDSTIGDWYASTCSLLKPLYDILKRQILESDYIQVDESTLPVIDNEKRRAIKGYVWVIRDAICGDAFFYYNEGSRSHSTIKKVLGTYRGAIQCDGYNAYDQFENRPGVLLLGCAAHCRRKFVEALKEDNQKASEAIMFFSKLYDLEKTLRENANTADEIVQIRKEKAYPILQLFEKWLIDTYSKVPKEGLIGKAISYTYSILPRLSRYVLDGRYNIDNNLCENTIRPLAIGRKNYLFCGNTASAIRTSMMYSFISSCKANNIDPREWFSYVIDNITRFQEQSLDLKELLPRNFIKE